MMSSGDTAEVDHFLYQPVKPLQVSLYLSNVLLHELITHLMGKDTFTRAVDEG